MDKNKINFIKIYDGDIVYSGANQYWATNKFHALSGCGPTTASEILAYLSVTYPLSCASLTQDMKIPLKKETFKDYITQVRAYVKPSINGLTDINFYQNQLLAFAKTKQVELSSNQISSELTADEAFEEIVNVIDHGLPLALLILKNPHKDIDPYTWHWMTVIGYDIPKKRLRIATHGREHELDFVHVWCQMSTCYSGLIYFWPKEGFEWSMSI